MMKKPGASALKGPPTRSDSADALRDELCWTPTPAEARRRMEARSGFLAGYSEEQVRALFSGALNPDL
jgi:hypothetical protein